MEFRIFTNLSHIFWENYVDLIYFWHTTKLTYHLSVKYFTWYMCVGGGVVRPPHHPLGMGMLYQVVIGRVAGVVEAVHFYIWLVSESWNSEKNFMEKSWNFISGSLWEPCCMLGATFSQVLDSLHALLVNPTILFVKNKSEQIYLILCFISYNTNSTGSVINS